MTPRQAGSNQDRLKTSDLKARAATAASFLPALLAQAEHLSQALTAGGHGRRHAGQGEEFWQYRPVQSGDSARSIDWRRSAQSDGHFVREQEWQTAHSVYVWCDGSASMQFASLGELPEKSQRAAVMSLALSMLLMKGGERVALLGGDASQSQADLKRPRTGTRHLTRMAEALALGTQTYISSDMSICAPHSKALLLSDFLGPLDEVELAIGVAVQRGITGVMLQVLDPVEASFPYEGRAIFEAMDAVQTHETLKADELKKRYLERLVERQNRLRRLAIAAGWQFQTHLTDSPASAALLWMFQALEGRQR